MKAQLPSTCNITYTRGVDREYNPYITIPSKYLSCTSESLKVSGLYAGYYNNINLSGEPVVEKVDEICSSVGRCFLPILNLQLIVTLSAGLANF